MWRSSITSASTGARHDWVGGAPSREMQVLAGITLDSYIHRTMYASMMYVQYLYIVQWLCEFLLTITHPNTIRIYIL